MRTKDTLGTILVCLAFALLGFALGWRLSQSHESIPVINGPVETPDTTVVLSRAWRREIIIKDGERTDSGWIEEPTKIEPDYTWAEEELNR